MTDAVRKSEELRQSAIAMLLDERGQLDDQLARLGWENGESATPQPTKRRGRPPKEKAAESDSAALEVTAGA